MNRFFAEGEEFALIERLFGPDHFTRDARGLGDDAFLLEPAPGSKWVITTDASVEGVHYRLDWTRPERALRKALMANLSDINAMGGVSRHAFFNLGARSEWRTPEFEQMGGILREMEDSFGFRVSGGDTVRTPGPGFFAFTILGVVEGTPLLRSASKPGHRVYVSGHLGGSAAGLSLLQEGKAENGTVKPEDDLIRAHFDPNPPLKLGPLLASLGQPVAAIDISDGLSSELWHLARQSGCSLRVERGKLPLHPALKAVCGEQASRIATDGGEEYQLLFTGNFSHGDLSRMSALAPITEIGVVAEGDGVFWAEDGVLSPLPPGGYSH